MNNKNNKTEEERILDASEFFKSLADYSRLRIIYTLLENKEMCVSELCKKVLMTQTAVSYQLKALREAYLVKTRRTGKNIYYSINDDHVKEIMNLTFIHLKEKEENDD